MESNADVLKRLEELERIVKVLLMKQQLAECKFIDTSKLPIG